MNKRMEAQQKRREKEFTITYEAFKNKPQYEVWLNELESTRTSYLDIGYISLVLSEKLRLKPSLCQVFSYLMRESQNGNSKILNKDIAYSCFISEDTVVKHLFFLTKTKFITIENHFSKNRIIYVNWYRLISLDILPKYSSGNIL